MFKHTLKALPHVLQAVLNIFVCILACVVLLVVFSPDLLPLGQDLTDEWLFLLCSSYTSSEWKILSQIVHQ